MPQPPQLTQKKPGLYKLLEGKHVGADLEAEPIPVLGPDGDQIGVKFPSKTYLPGQVFRSIKDLAAWDPRKFAKLEEPPRVTFNPGATVAPASPPSSDELPDTPPDAPGPAGTIPAGRLEEPTSPDELPAAPPDDPGPDVTEGQSRFDREYGPLEQFTKSDLQALAQENQIDLHGVSKKEDIIAKIRAAGR